MIDREQPAETFADTIHAQQSVSRHCVPFLVGATHCVALLQPQPLPEEGEAVPRPYSHGCTIDRAKPAPLRRKRSLQSSKAPVIPRGANATTTISAPP